MNIPKTVSDLSVIARRLILNKYGLVFFIFLIWMLFFDSRNMIVQVKLSKKIDNLKKEKKEYASKYKKIIKEKHDLNENLEKFAREKYFMHKENEVVYIIE
ncbi:MAG TPA: septum formation initiator family protein [Saprospiraceae bacterium]|nr:septum formation initiator family protein [Saprospiraceae bacterium]